MMITWWMGLWSTWWMGPWSTWYYYYYYYYYQEMIFVHADPRSPMEQPVEEKEHRACVSICWAASWNISKKNAYLVWNDTAYLIYIIAIWNEKLCQIHSNTDIHNLLKKSKQLWIWVRMHDDIHNFLSACTEQGGIYITGWVSAMRLPMDLSIGSGALTSMAKKRRSDEY